MGFTFWGPASLFPCSCGPTYMPEASLLSVVSKLSLLRSPWVHAIVHLLVLLSWEFTYFHYIYFLLRAVFEVVIFSCLQIISNYLMLICRVVIIVKEILQFQLVFCLPPESCLRAISNFQVENFFCLFLTSFLAHYNQQSWSVLCLLSEKYCDGMCVYVCFSECRMCISEGIFYCDVNFI